MTKQQKKDLLSVAYTTMEKNGETIHILDTDKVDTATQGMLLDMQRDLDVGFDMSYEIVAEACSIVGDKDLEYLEGENFDSFADADSVANVYTGVQLSYLKVYNESEISDLMKDEAITSIAQACSIWHSQKVAEAVEMLVTYIKS